LNNIGLFIDYITLKFIDIEQIAGIVKVQDFTNKGQFVLYCFCQFCSILWHLISYILDLHV